jgi:hypothetical protein
MAMKKFILLLLIIGFKSLAQSVELKPGSNGFVMIPNVSSLGTCAVADKGKIVYYGTDNTLRMYNGSSWIPVNGTGFSLPFLQIITDNTSFPSNLFDLRAFGTNPYLTAITAKANKGTGIYGYTNTSKGVHGEGNGLGDGVYGESRDGIGLHGESENATGVYGNSFDSTGVYGNSSFSNIGVPGFTHSATGVLGETCVGTGIKGIATHGIGGYFSANSNSKVLITDNGKVSIGNINPNLNAEDRMEINGRLRIRDSTNTARVWFNNSNNGIGLDNGAFYGLETATPSAERAGIWIGSAWRFYINRLGQTTFTGFTQLRNSVPVAAAPGATAPSYKDLEVGRYNKCQ